MTKWQERATKMILQVKTDNKNDCPIYECPHCGGEFHRLTTKAKTNIVADGTFFKVLPHIQELMWETFEEDRHIQGPSLSCPECEQEYTNTVTGHLIETSIQNPVDQDGNYR